MIDHCKEEKIRKQEIIGAFSTLCIGVLIHLYVLTNHITLHDNVYNFYWGGTVELGRWGLYLLFRFTNLWNGNYLHYSAPGYLGVLSIIFISLAAAVVTKILKLGKAASAVLVGMIMVSFPVVTAVFGFMFTSAAYFFGMFIGVIGAYLISSRDSIVCFAAGVFLIAFGTGVYQAFLPFFGALLLLDAIRRIRQGEKSRFLRYLLAGAVSVTVYALLLKIFLGHYDAQLSNYQGIGLVTSTGPLAYLKQVLRAYAEFFYPSKWAQSTMYPGSLRILYYVVLLLVAGFAIFDLFKSVKSREYLKALKLLGLYVLMPLMANGIFVMSASSPDTVHSLMMYGELLPFLYLILMMDEIADRKVMAVVTVCLVLFSVMSWRLANICYWKADYVERAADAYFNRLVTRMETESGYAQTQKAVFIGQPAVDEHVLMYGEFDLEVGRYPYGLWPYNLATMVENYNWLAYLRSETGFGLPIEDSSEWKDRAEIRKMPCYPEPGSIAVFDDCIVVKFSNAE